jgi:hypothetical protein
MAFYPGDVLLIYCDRQRLTLPDGRAGKHKYIICVDRNQLLFFFINSDPFRKLIDTQIPVTPSDLSFLPNDVSYIDTRKMTKFRYDEVEDQIRRAPQNVKGSLPAALREQLRVVALSHGLLFGWQEEILERNFPATLD